MSTIRSAAIIGGGVAGPVTALALQKAGIDSTIYEAYATPANGVGGMLTIAPNGFAAFDIVGAGDAVRVLGQPIERMVLVNGAGRRLAEFPTLTGLAASRVMWRSELYRVLHDRATASGIRVAFGKRLIGVHETRDGIVAQFDDGSEARADVLIGADGIRSTVRRLIDPNAPMPKYAGMLGFGGCARNAGVPGDVGTMVFTFGDRGFFGYWKQTEGVTMWFVNMPYHVPLTSSETHGVPSARWLDILRDTLEGDAVASALLRRSQPEELLALGAMELLPSIPAWHRGRMALVGDSAHAPSSSSGQGASLAAESAIEVARCLRDLPDVPAAFEKYEQLRRSRVEKIAAAAMKTNNDKRSGPLKKALMSIMMPIAMKLLTPEKIFGPVQRFQIHWDSPVLD